MRQLVNGQTMPFREAQAILERLGYRLSRVTGSHHVYTKSGKPRHVLLLWRRGVDQDRRASGTSATEVESRESLMKWTEELSSYGRKVARIIALSNGNYSGYLLTKGRVNLAIYKDSEDREELKKTLEDCAVAGIHEAEVQPEDWVKLIVLYDEKKIGEIEWLTGDRFRVGMRDFDSTLDALIEVWQTQGHKGEELCKT